MDTADMEIGIGTGAPYENSGTSPASTPQRKSEEDMTTSAAMEWSSRLPTAEIQPGVKRYTDCMSAALKPNHISCTALFKIQSRR